MSYFAKPNFLIYDEWFDYDFVETKLDFKNKKIKNISTIHEFFYEKSNYKFGASENNLKLEFKKAEDKSGISSNLSFNDGNFIGTTLSL